MSELKIFEHLKFGRIRTILIKRGSANVTKKESTPEISQGLTEKDFQLMEELADREFTAFLQSIIVPQCLNNQKVNDF